MQRMFLLYMQSGDVSITSMPAEALSSPIPDLHPSVFLRTAAPKRRPCSLGRPRPQKPRQTRNMNSGPPLRPNPPASIPDTIILNARGIA
ncbi:hypothetical protein HD806DRAFT_248270 [Xylariaceae sp. AK1471]|nr:hypothetical protein HD806DRAFT_248270 [Xylariaceae sp. AK1471]